MTNTRRARGSSERGFALAVVLSMILLLSGIVAALHTNVMGNTIATAAHFKAPQASMRPSPASTRAWGAIATFS
jgi:Tfp pilus assembly protein PilX